MLTTTLNTIGTNGEAEVAGILATPVGAILAFIIGMLIIVTVTALVISVIKYAKRHTSKVK